MNVLFQHDRILFSESVKVSLNSIDVTGHVSMILVTFLFDVVHSHIRVRVSKLVMYVYVEVQQC